MIQQKFGDCFILRCGKFPTPSALTLGVFYWRDEIAIHRFPESLGPSSKMRSERRTKCPTQFLPIIAPHFGGIWHITSEIRILPEPIFVNLNVRKLGLYYFLDALFCKPFHKSGGRYTCKYAEGDGKNDDQAPDLVSPDVTP